MNKSITIAALALSFLVTLTATTSANPPQIPPGLEQKGFTLLSVCDCLAVEVRQSVFENRDILFSTARDLVGSLIVSGFIHCTEPDSEVETSGESVLRLILFMLSGEHPGDQEFCRIQ